MSRYTQPLQLEHATVVAATARDTQACCLCGSVWHRAWSGELPASANVSALTKLTFESTCCDLHVPDDVCVDDASCRFCRYLAVSGTEPVQSGPGLDAAAKAFSHSTDSVSEEARCPFVYLAVSGTESGPLNPKP